MSDSFVQKQTTQHQRLSFDAMERMIQTTLSKLGFRAPATRQERRQKLEEKAELGDIPEGGLVFIALARQKDLKTVRRWCKQGLVPGAYQTPGGHWRVPFESVYLPMPLVDKVARAPRSLMGNERTKQLLKAMNFVLLEMGVLNVGKRRDKLLGNDSAGFADKTRKAIRAIKDVKEFKAARLYLAAQQAQFQQLKTRKVKRLTAGMLAKQLSISRATLYRQHTRAEIARAIGVDREVQGAIEAEIEQLPPPSTTPATPPTRPDRQEANETDLELPRP